MPESNGGQLLARCLANEGVRFVFGLPSPEIDPLLAALEEHGIRLVPVRHEAAGAHMAEGLYKTTGQVAAVIGNPGPGSANLLAGVITARHEGVPMVAITSQHRLGIVYPSPPVDLPGTGSARRLPRRRQVGRADLRVGAHPRGGAARLPRDVDRPAGTGADRAAGAGALRDRRRVDRAACRAPSAYRAPLPEASDAQIARVADLLADAARPLVIAGSGVDRAGANAALLGSSSGSAVR